MKHNEFISMVLNAIDLVVAQGTQCTRGGVAKCCYLDSTKTRCCVVGHMMPDNTTREAADNHGNSGISKLYELGFNWTQQFTPQQIDLLSKLQYTHDANRTMIRDIFLGDVAKYRIEVEGSMYRVNNFLRFIRFI